MKRNAPFLLPGRRTGPRNKSVGITLIEMLIAVSILSVLILTVVSSMITYGRSFKSDQSQARMQDLSRHLTQRLHFLAATASSFEVFQNGNGLCIVYQHTNDNGVQTHYTAEFLYENGDGDDATLEDNRIVERTYDSDGTELWRRTRLTLVSKVDNNTPVFRSNNQASRLLVEMLVRTGDRTNPADRKLCDVALADDALTGPGFQGYLLRTALTPGN